MSTPPTGRLRAATAHDAAPVLALWDLLFGEDDTAPGTTWRRQAHEWFRGAVEDGSTARLPVVEVDGDVVAAAVGTLELGVPNPHCPRGRVVRLANVVTVPGHRGRGYATLLVRDVVGWARSIDADRVDLSATPDGERLYENLGFSRTRAPRMKLVLE